jgi:hypothetical protein
MAPSRVQSAARECLFAWLRCATRNASRLSDTSPRHGTPTPSAAAPTTHPSRRTASGTRGSHPTPRRPRSRDRSVQVWAFAEDSDGALWMGTSRGLVRRVSNQTILYVIQPLRGADHVYALLVDRENRTWIGHATGLIVFCHDQAGSTRSSRVQHLSMKPGSRLHMKKLTGVAGEAIRFTTADGYPGRPSSRFIRPVTRKYGSEPLRDCVGSMGGVAL